MKEHGYHPENVNFREPEDKGNYYLISYGNKSGAGVGAVRVYKDGLVKSGAGSLASTENADLDKVGYYQFATNQNSTSSSNIVNNEQQNQTAHSNILVPLKKIIILNYKLKIILYQKLVNNLILV